MSKELELVPLSKQIDAALGPDYDHVLFVVQKRTPEQAAAGIQIQSQYVSPMERRAAWKTLRTFIEVTKDNPMFNPDLHL